VVCKRNLFVRDGIVQVGMRHEGMTENKWSPEICGETKFLPLPPRPLVEPCESRKANFAYVLQALTAYLHHQGLSNYIQSIYHTQLNRRHLTSIESEGLRLILHQGRHGQQLCSVELYSISNALASSNMPTAPLHSESKSTPLSRQP
jgi:hypothetical protein